MTRHLAVWACGAALAVALAAPQASAQSDGLVERGVRAYQDVEFAAAATLLRRALAGGISDSERIQALAYLGAAEVFVGPQRRDSARAAFRRLVLSDPRYRPDPLAFPPRVLTVYEDVRRATKAVLWPHATLAIPATSLHRLSIRVGRRPRHRRIDDRDLRTTVQGARRA